MPHTKSNTHANAHHSSHNSSAATEATKVVDAAQAGEAPDTASPALPTFADLRPALHEGILRAVANEGYTTPTPIQAQAIPHVAAGRDVLGCAQTGTGKTAAFSLPILHRLAQSASKQPHPNQHHHRPIRALILSPTRELALQIEQSLRTYGKHLHLRTTCVFGGVGQGAQTRALQAGVDILIATPGRLQDLMGQGYISLAQVEIFVLDEADRMLDMGFITPIREITAEIPKKRQTLLFSATMPKEIRHLADSLLTDPVSVQIAAVASTPDLVTQSLYHVSRHNKPALLTHFLKTVKSDRVIVFTRTKHGADRVSKDLNHDGIRADAIHGNKRQNVRQRTLGDFRNGRIRVLVATDVAARGIDVDGISHVINFDLPNEPESYVHRIGRTARAGTSGEAISFCDRSGDERDFLRDIERLIRKAIPVRDDAPELAPPGPSGSDSRSGGGHGGSGGGHRAQHRGANSYGARSGYGHRSRSARGDDFNSNSNGNGNGYRAQRDPRDQRDSRDARPFGPRDAAPSDRRSAFDPRAAMGGAGGGAPQRRPERADRPTDRSSDRPTDRQNWSDSRDLAPAPDHRKPRDNRDSRDQRTPHDRRDHQEPRPAHAAPASPQSLPQHAQQSKKKVHRKGGTNAAAGAPSHESRAHNSAGHKPGAGAGKHASSSSPKPAHGARPEVHVRKPGFGGMNKRPTRGGAGGGSNGGNNKGPQRGR